MRHQTGEEKKRKKGRRPDETGSEKRNPNPEIGADDDIDPAELFDPEEFGVRRKIGPFRP
jgi:hypothetical protein